MEFKNDGIFEQVKNLLSGEQQWRDAIESQGLELPKKGKGGSCPVCGGDDRFTFNNKFGQGNSFCRKCPSDNPNGKSRDGISLVADALNISPLEAAKRLGHYLGIKEEPSEQIIKVNFSALIRNDEKKKRAAEEARQQAEKLKNGGHKAQYILDNYCQPASKNQEYLVKKKVNPFGTYELIKPVQDFSVGSLVVPIYGESGCIQSLELIASDKKRPLMDCPKGGGFFPIGSLEGQKRIIVAESFGTGASLKEVFGCGVVSSFSAGNIKAVAEAISRLCPNSEILIGADNDGHKDDAGEKAARATGLPWSMPTNTGNDWSDVYLSGGDVKAEFEQNIKGRIYGANEARNRLEETIEAILRDFMSTHQSLESSIEFFHALVVATAGIGKSTTVLKVIKKLLARINFAEYYTPTTALGYELAQKAKALGIPTAVIEGRNEKTCKRHEAAEKLGKAGVPVHSTLCMVKEGKKVYLCEHYGQCPYIKQFNTDAKLRVHATEKLHLKRGLDSFEVDQHEQQSVPDFVVIDEQMHSTLAKSTKIDANKIMEAPIPDKAKSILTNWLSTDEKPELSEPLILALVALKKASTPPNIWPDMSDNDIKEAISSFKPQYAMIKLIEAIGDEDESKVKIVNGKFSLVWKKEITRFDYKIDGKPHRIPVLNIDASGRKKVVEAATGWRFTEHEIKVSRDNVEFIQALNSKTKAKGKSFSMASLGLKSVKNEKMLAEIEALRADVMKFIGEVAQQHSKVILVTYKGLCEQWKGSLPNNVDLANFGALRGLDGFKDHDCAIVLGRNQPHEDDTKIQSRALFGNESQAGLVMEMIRDDETEQAIDRLRLVGSTTHKTVYLLTDSLPADIKPDQTITWSQAKGTRRSPAKIIDQLVERFGGVPNVALAFKLANDILKVSNLDAAKKFYKRHLKESLRGQFPIRIYIGCCPPNEISIRKPFVSVPSDYSPERIKNKLFGLGLEILSIESQQETETPKEPHIDTETTISTEEKTQLLQPEKITPPWLREPQSVPPQIVTADLSHQTACGVRTETTLDFLTGLDVVTLEAVRDDHRIDLLPDDYRWLRGLLKSRRDEPELLEQYRQIWLEAANDPNLKEHQKQNAGRFAANQWILKNTQIAL